MIHTARLYRFYWKDGKMDFFHGDTVKEALTNAGYGAGALAALDFYESTPEPTYEWNKETRNWDKKEG